MLLLDNSLCQNILQVYITYYILYNLKFLKMNYKYSSIDPYSETMILNFNYNQSTPPLNKMSVS
jgi:hypothetical protein